jgi:hypothetical protein
MRVVALFIGFWGWSALVAGQSLESVWEPAVTVTRTLTDRHSLTAQASAFHSPEHVERVEGSLFVNRRITVRTTLSTGYLLRVGTPFEDTRRFENRITGQATHSFPSGIHQVSYRGRLEWRMRESGDAIRIRLRASVRSPLQGERLDPGEPYLLLQNEVLGTRNMDSASGSADNRISAHLGWLLRNRQRVEVGIQHRLEDIGQPGDTHVLLLSTAWHFTR